jgi:hypothetical protein
MLDVIALGWMFGFIGKQQLVIEVIDDEERLVDISNLYREPNGWFSLQVQPSKRPSGRPRGRQSSIRCSVYRSSIA